MEANLKELESSKRRFGTILIDPPWRFQNLTGKVGPEHKRLYRYPTMSFEEIKILPVGNWLRRVTYTFGLLMPYYWKLWKL